MQNRTRWLIAVTVGTAMIIGLVGVWWAVGGANALSQLMVGDLLAASSELHPIEATKELCGDL